MRRQKVEPARVGKRISGNTNKALYYTLASSTVLEKTDNIRYTRELDNVFLAAAKYGDMDILLRTLDRHSININVRDEHNGDTALILAVKGDNAKVVEELVERGADVTALNEDGKSAMDVASNYIKLAVLSRYPKKTADNAVAIIKAAWQGDIVSLKGLLSSKTNGGNRRFIKSTSEEGLTPLLVVTRDINIFLRLQRSIKLSYEPVKVIQELLRYKVDVNAMDIEGHTALHFATRISAQKLCKDVVELLLLHRPILNSLDRTNLAPLHTATNNDNLQVVAALVEAGANPNLHGIGGATPLHIGAQQENEAIIRKLVLAGGDVNALDSAGMTPLCVARTTKIRDLMRSLFFDLASDQGLHIKIRYDELSNKRRLQKMLDTAPPPAPKKEPELGQLDFKPLQRKLISDMHPKQYDYNANQRVPRVLEARRVSMSSEYSRRRKRTEDKTVVSLLPRIERDNPVLLLKRYSPIEVPILQRHNSRLRDINQAGVFITQRQNASRKTDSSSGRPPIPKHTCGFVKGPKSRQGSAKTAKSDKGSNMSGENEQWLPGAPLIMGSDSSRPNSGLTSSSNSNKRPKIHLKEVLKSILANIDNNEGSTEDLLARYVQQQRPVRVKEMGFVDFLLQDNDPDKMSEASISGRSHNLSDSSSLSGYSYNSIQVVETLPLAPSYKNETISRVETLTNYKNETISHRVESLTMHRVTIGEASTQHELVDHTALRQLVASAPDHGHQLKAGFVSDNVRPSGLGLRRNSRVRRESYEMCHDARCTGYDNPPPTRRNSIDQSPESPRRNSLKQTNGTRRNSVEHSPESRKNVIKQTNGSRRTSTDHTNCLRRNSVKPPSVTRRNSVKQCVGMQRGSIEQTIVARRRSIQQSANSRRDSVDARQHPDASLDPLGGRDPLESDHTRTVSLLNIDTPYSDSRDSDPKISSRCSKDSGYGSVGTLLSELHVQDNEEAPPKHITSVVVMQEKVPRDGEGADDITAPLLEESADVISNDDVTKLLDDDDGDVVNGTDVVDNHVEAVNVTQEDKMDHPEPPDIIEVINKVVATPKVGFTEVGFIKGRQIKSVAKLPNTRANKFKDPSFKKRVYNRKLPQIKEESRTRDSYKKMSSMKLKVRERRLSKSAKSGNSDSSSMSRSSSEKETGTPHPITAHTKPVTGTSAHTSKITTKRSRTTADRPKTSGTDGQHVDVVVEEEEDVGISIKEITNKHDRMLLKKLSTVKDLDKLVYGQPLQLTVTTATPVASDDPPTPKSRTNSSSDERDNKDARSLFSERRSILTDFTGTTKIESIMGETTQWKKGRLLGTGASGKVWYGVTLEKMEVAVKQIELCGEHEDAIEEYMKLQEEVKLLKCLKHDNIIRYYGTCLQDNNVNIFMEYVDGGSLSSRIKKHASLPERLVQNFTYQLLDALSYIHAKNIVHRDIKGQNILITGDDKVKLIDFGCSKRLRRSLKNADALKTFRGTPYWMSPEVIKECGHGTKSDIWSLSCTVYEMMTGNPPWHTYPTMAAMYKIGTGKAVPCYPDNASDYCIDFMKACFVVDPKDRPSADCLLKHEFIELFSNRLKNS